MSSPTLHRRSSHPTRALRLLWRAYEELLLPSRLATYRALLQEALDRGYRVVDLAEWCRMVEYGVPPSPLLVLRHDIDTDPGLSLGWHAIERELGCRSSYFFRLSTLDAGVIDRLAQDSIHVSYHFEELADVAKERRLRHATDLAACMPEIRERFAVNLQRLRRQFGLPMDIVCSHGDWMNRRLGVTNAALLDDAEFRRRIGIRHEAYDDVLQRPFAAYISDGSPPAYWLRGDPFEKIRAGLTPVGLLTHPKHWRAHLPSNARELARRFKEAAAHRAGS